MYWATEGRRTLEDEYTLGGAPQSIELLAALLAVTSVPSKLLYGETMWGTIAPRMSADLVLLSTNPLSPESWKDGKRPEVEMTFFEGKRVFGGNG